MMTDWKDALASLQGSLPKGEEEKVTDKNATAPSVSGTAGKMVKKSGKVNIAYERKGRGGKSVTIIYGFADTESDDDIAALATRLKQRLGTGGSSRGGEILLQGDVREKVKALLRAEGYSVK